MKARVGINGFGRIGRLVAKALLAKYPDIELVAVNDLMDVKLAAHLFKYDSTYGPYHGDVKAEGDHIVINGKKVKVLSERDPHKLPWKELEVDIVIESTGLFRTKEKAIAHIEAGAKKVIISAPAKGEDITIVLGVNEDKYLPESHHVISNASCTTNCLAPVAKVINDNFKIKKGVMTTIHSYTNDQRILDLPHKDYRRARAAALNIIPTTTGAAKALALVIPELKGKFDGIAVRVPTPTVSLVDFVAEVEKEADLEMVKKALKDAANSERMKGILAYCEEPLVSMDFKGDTHSSIVDADNIMVMGKNMVKVVSWYDNEMGYSNRVADLVNFVLEKEKARV